MCVGVDVQAADAGAQAGDLVGFKKLMGSMGAGGNKSHIEKTSRVRLCTSHLPHPHPSSLCTHRTALGKQVGYRTFKSGCLATTREEQ